MVRQNTDVFALHDSEILHTFTTTLDINTRVHPPISRKPYWISLTSRKIIERAIDNIQDGIISKTISS